MIKGTSKDLAYQNILPLIKDLMKDDVQEVRKGSVEAGVKFIEIMGPDTFSSLQASLKSSSDDTKWRVRLELMKSIADLAVKANVL